MSRFEIEPDPEIRRRKQAVAYRDAMAIGFLALALLIFYFVVFRGPGMYVVRGRTELETPAVTDGEMSAARKALTTGGRP